MANTWPSMIMWQKYLYLHSHFFGLLLQLLYDLVAGAAVVASGRWAVLLPLLQADPAEIVLTLNNKGERESSCGGSSNKINWWNRIILRPFNTHICFSLFFLFIFISIFYWYILLKYFWICFSSLWFVLTSHQHTACHFSQYISVLQFIAY